MPRPPWTEPPLRPQEAKAPCSSPPSWSGQGEDGCFTGTEAWHAALNHLPILQVTCVQVTPVGLVPCKVPWMRPNSGYC